VCNAPAGDVEKVTAEGEAVKLHIREWGGGDKIAVLIHGLTSDSTTWDRVGPALAGRGYRVLALDLRGHGLSPRGPYDPQSWAHDVVESLLPSPRPQLIVGHSLGGVVLSLAVDRLRPSRAVYSDPAWRIPSPAHAGAREMFAAQKSWTREEIAASRPHWGPAEVDLKFAALQHWDAASAKGFFDGREWDYSPGRPVVPSLVLLADPSALVSPERAEELRQSGFEVRIVPGAGHTIYCDDFEGFMAGLEGWV
jgi:pimeloyl-ACP methyl ester carboxylesterase